MPEQPLALTYRPRTFEDLAGQPVVRTVLSKMVADITVPPGLLFTGVRGAGKTTSGRILAAALNCEKHPSGPCGHCAGCVGVFSGTSPDVIEVDAASSGLVSDVRTLTEMVQYSTAGLYRVCLIDEAHSLSREGFNALLKTLEEPPANTIFILLTTEPHRIPETIVSRCMSFDFRKIPVADIVGRLNHIVASEGVEVDPDVLTMIASRSDGGLRDAVMVLDQCIRAGALDAQLYRDLIGVSDFAPGIVQAILDSDLVAAYARVDAVVGTVGEPLTVVTEMIRVLKDIVVLAGGGKIALVGSELMVREQLSHRMSTGLAVSWMRVLWEVKTKVRIDDSPVSLIYLAVALLSEIGKPAQQTTPIVQEQKRLTVAEMRAM